MLSYGPCQFPTLGLIVQRKWEIMAHIPEDFWYLEVLYRSPPPEARTCVFKWRRGRVFD